MSSREWVNGSVEALSPPSEVEARAKGRVVLRGEVVSPSSHAARPAEREDAREQ